MYLGLSILLLGLAVLGYMNAANKNTNELGLEILSWIKNIKGENVSLDKMIPSKLLSIDHSDWSNLLERYVSEEGAVDYTGFQSNSVELHRYLDHLSQNAPAPGWTKEEELAYWINAYNAFTVKLILDHYPLKSIKDISDGLPMINSPWDIKFFKIGGLDFDLNTIEHEILRKKFDDPRIHFAINCASISCPRLRNEAYIPSKIEYQLNDQAHYFINNKLKNQIGTSELKLSSIFNWFQGDFIKHESLHSFLRKYNTNVQDESKISYLKYDWELNE